ncbi:unnamed protein product [Eruca vesicaria subsp. sativa]|uniref:MADS-box domain-containing protein n=1 Tax=Eruca vesicaria subsp. sativa TaxID=29727 RepID=A0ABC8M9P4_ERUVS|nr:unnamed protein product [Eruca vesicaria subsp. sativa]
MASSSSSFFPSSSSSSSMTKKPTHLSQFRATLFQKASSLKAKSLASRQETVFKKAEELSILCGVEVCVIYYGSDGELKTWPKEREKVKDIALRYIQLSDEKREVKRYDLEKFLKKINKDDSKKKNKKNNKKVKLGSNLKYPDWDPRFDNYSVEQLTELIQSLERKQPEIQNRLRAVVESQRNVHYMNMANQEPMQMNHLQQQLLPNQAQSLAPIPNSLTVYQHPNMDMYSRLLGGQETGMNEFLGRNLLPYNSFNSNCATMFSNQFNQNCSKVEDYSVFPQGSGFNNVNVEDYSGLLCAQGTNGLQNMDMYGYNNSNNGFSHQYEI